MARDGHKILSPQFYKDHFFLYNEDTETTRAQEKVLDQCWAALDAQTAAVQEIAADNNVTDPPALRFVEISTPVQSGVVIALQPQDIGKYSGPITIAQREQLIKYLQKIKQELNFK